VAAGAVGSPLVLMRSVIGPEPHLREIGSTSFWTFPESAKICTDHAAASVIYRSAGPMHLPRAVLLPRYAGKPWSTAGTC
jgi:choline dehydrogenase-like flavoprotein